MLKPFAERIRAPPWWTWTAFDAPRWRLALCLAAVPPLTLVAAALAFPDLAARVVDPTHVRDAFARYISGLITAATIAVSFAALSLQRGIRGVAELHEHVRADRAFADRVRALCGDGEPPMAVGPLLATLLDEVGERAARVVAEGEAAVFAAELAEHARGAAAQVRANADAPERMYRAALDFEVESAVHGARRLGLRDLDEALYVTDIARSYAKTLGVQWGLSRMSLGIAGASFVAVSAATFVVLGYDLVEPRIVPLLVVAATFWLALLPLAVFVSFVLRAIFLNQHSLPLGHFVLGPENEPALRDQR